MYALVDRRNSITKYFNHPKGFTLGDLQYPSRHIYEMVGTEEKEAIGIYEVVL